MRSLLSIVFLGVVACSGGSDPARATATPDGELDAATLDAGPDAPAADSGIDAEACGSAVCKSNEYCDFEDGACGEVNPGSAVCRAKPLDCSSTIPSTLLTRCTCAGNAQTDTCPALTAVRNDKSCFATGGYVACGHGFCAPGGVCATVPSGPSGAYTCVQPPDGCDSCACMPDAFPLFGQNLSGCRCSGTDTLTLDCTN